MDLETLRLILPVVGTLAGALVGGFSAYFVTLANISGQRATANDNALREWRAALLRPILDAAMKRATQYDQVVYAATRGDAEFINEILDQYHRAQLSWLATPLTHLAGSDLDQALKALRDADDESATIVAMLLHELGRTDLGEQTRHAGLTMGAAIAQLYRATERFVYETKPRPRRWP